MTNEQTAVLLEAVHARFEAARDEIEKLAPEECFRKKPVLGGAVRSCSVSGPVDEALQWLRERIDTLKGSD